MILSRERQKLPLTRNQTRHSTHLREEKHGYSLAGTSPGGVGQSNNTFHNDSFTRDLYPLFDLLRDLRSYTSAPGVSGKLTVSSRRFSQISRQNG